jgi:hypothetical protein
MMMMMTASAEHCGYIFDIFVTIRLEYIGTNV